MGDGGRETSMNCRDLSCGLDELEDQNLRVEQRLDQVEQLVAPGRWFNTCSGPYRIDDLFADQTGAGGSDLSGKLSRRPDRVPGPCLWIPDRDAFDLAGPGVPHHTAHRIVGRPRATGSGPARIHGFPVPMYVLSETIWPCRIVTDGDIGEWVSDL
jgi:hypothetical protein